MTLALSTFCETRGVGRGGWGKDSLGKCDFGAAMKVTSGHASTLGKTVFGKVLDSELSHVLRRCGKDTFRWLALLILYKATLVSLDPPIFMGLSHLLSPRIPRFGIGSPLDPPRIPPWIPFIHSAHGGHFSQFFLEHLRLSAPTGRPPPPPTS